MSPKRLAKAALLGLVAGAVAAAGACSLILPAGDLDAQYGADAGGGGPGTSASTSAGTSASTSSGAGGGGDDAGCCADGGCASDPANCGTCGHVCPPDMSCTHGVCPAGALVNAEAVVFGCGGGWVYWSDGTSTTQIRPGGGPSWQCASNQGTDIVTIAEGRVMIGTSDTSFVRHIFAIPVSDCSQGEPAQTDIGIANAWKIPSYVDVGVTTDGTNAYWLDDFHVMRAPIADDAGAAPLYTWDASTPQGASGLVLAGPLVLVNATETQELLVLSTNGGAPSPPHASYQSYGVQTNGAYAVWASSHPGGSGVYVVPLTGAQPFQTWTSPLPGSPAIPTGVAIDESYVYATDGAQGLILRWTLADPDAGPTTLETDAAAPSMLCADGPNLYWLASGGVIYQGDKNPPSP